MKNRISWKTEHNSVVLLLLYFTLKGQGLKNYLSLCRWGENDDPTILWLQNLFSQKEVCPSPWTCLEVQRNPSEFRAALHSFCQCLHCALGLCRKAKGVFQEEWDEHIAEICVLEGTRALWLVWMWEKEGEYWFSCTLREPELTIKVWILGASKMILQVTVAPGWWMTHAVRSCYPGFCQSFCNSEKEAVQKIALLV